MGSVRRVLQVVRIGQISDSSNFSVVLFRNRINENMNLTVQSNISATLMTWWRPWLQPCTSQWSVHSHISSCNENTLVRECNHVEFLHRLRHHGKWWQWIECSRCRRSPDQLGCCRGSASKVRSWSINSNHQQVVFVWNCPVNDYWPKNRISEWGLYLEDPIWMLCLILQTLHLTGYILCAQC